MSEETEFVEMPAAPEPNGTPEYPLEILLKRRPRKVYAGMWGPFEIVTTAFAGTALLAAILLYIFAVVPSNRELAKNRSEAERLEAEVASANTKYGEITSTEEQVGKLLRSVDDFERNYLPPAATGQSALYQRLNGLILAYGLTNTTGPDYAPLETVDQSKNNQTDEERGREKYRSLFPGVYMTVTLEGPYQNLRRFIREIETGNEFLVISSIELEPSDSQQKKPPIGAPPAQTASITGPNQNVTVAGIQGAARVDPNTGQPLAGPSASKGKTHGEVVALRLEMAAYFRRPNYAPVSPPETGKQ